MINPDFEKELTKKVEIEKWHRKVREEPRNAELYFTRGMFFIDQRMTKEAQSDFKKATELAPDNSLYREFYRRTLIHQENTSEKIQ